MANDQELQIILREALRAYEHARAVNLQAGRQAKTWLDQTTAELTAAQQAEHDHLERTQKSRLAVASGEQARLGDLTAMTYGLKYGRTLRSGNELSLRVEYYAQTGESHPADAFGDLRDFDLFPTVDAWIVNVGYTFGK